MSTTTKEEVLLEEAEILERRADRKVEEIRLMINDVLTARPTTDTVWERLAKEYPDLNADDVEGIRGLYEATRGNPEAILVLSRLSRPF